MEQEGNDGNETEKLGCESKYSKLVLNFVLRKKMIHMLNAETIAKYYLSKDQKRIKRFYDNNVKFLFKIKKLKKEVRNEENYGG